MLGVLDSKDIRYITADENRDSNDHREERIVNTAGKARNSIKPGSQPQFSNQGPSRTFYEEEERSRQSIPNTNPPRTTYYEYGNPQQILHRAQDRNDDYNVATRLGDFLFLKLECPGN